MDICIKDSFFVFWTLSSSLINCLCGELFIVRAGCGLCFDVHEKVSENFALCVINK